MLALCLSSCEKDTTEFPSTSDALSFEVEVSGSWSDGAASSGTTIKRMSQSSDAAPLYLVTKISAPAPAPADAAAEGITRGTPVEQTATLETGGFGLSAICYTGSWPADAENNWTTNFAHNLNVTKQGTKWKTSEKLEWPGSGNIKFFAYYPYSANSAGCISHSASDKRGIPTLTYTVPDDVTRQPDLLFAVADHTGKSTGDGSVELRFEHALTAVTIKTGDKMLSGKITGITLSGVYGEGSCPIGGSTWSYYGTPRDFEIEDLEVVLDKKTDDNGIGINTTPGEAVTDGELTFMMIPQKLPPGAQLIVYFEDNLTHTARTLTASLGGTSWPSGRKVAYSINTTGIVIEPVLEMTVNRDGQWPGGGYAITPVTKNEAYTMYGAAMTEEKKTAYLPVSGYLHDVDITAYVKVTQAQADDQESREKTIELPFEIEYSTDNGTSWQTGRWIPDEAAGEAAAASETGITASKKGGIALEAQPQFTELRNYFTTGYSGNPAHPWLTPTARTTLTKEGKGSKAEPHDLVAENPVAPGQSANCYIINDHGYYRFPVCYGNTYNAADNSAYHSNPDLVDEDSKDYCLEWFVKHDNDPISMGAGGTVWIEDVADAVIVWQDSPDLVEDVELRTIDGQKWITFHTAEPALSQGNAMIAVRDASRTILWSWHIWATHYDWQNEGAMIHSGSKREGDGVEYLLTPCNLGYCEPHGEDDARTVSMRFRVTLPDDSKEVRTPVIKGSGCPAPTDAGVITFTQPAIAESVAGDNTYYQWGRKDPMLPGVYNKAIYDARAEAGDKTNWGTGQNELTMDNKMFYSTSEYRIGSDDTSKSIGDGIRNPHIFFIHQRPPEDGAATNADQTNWLNNLKRRHWHDGTNTPYAKHALMNYWNTQLYKENAANTTSHPNGIYVAKTIYDPSPAGYKIPSPNAYITFGPTTEISRPLTANDKVYNNGQAVGWKLNLTDGGTIFYPATGVRDIGLKPWDHTRGTFPAFADVTFISSAGFIYDKGSASYYSCSLFSIDNRNSASGNKIKATYATSNSYGLTLRPILDQAK